MALEEGMLEEGMSTGSLLGVLLKALREKRVKSFREMRRGSSGVSGGTGGICSLESERRVGVVVTAVMLTRG